MEHRITHRNTLGPYLVRCSCGWGFQIHKQNVLARAAQIRAAIRKHLREMQEAQKVNIKRNEFGRYMVVKVPEGRHAWSGSRWVPIDNMGFPTGQTQVSNFETMEEATRYAIELGFNVANV